MAKRIKTLPTPDLSQPLSPELLGQAIRARRTQSKLRLEDAAVLCNVAKDTLMQIEHGHSSCQLSSLLQVCDSLGIKLFIQPWQETDEANDGWY